MINERLNELKKEWRNYLTGIDWLLSGGWANIHHLLLGV